MVEMLSITKSMIIVVILVVSCHYSQIVVAIDEAYIVDNHVRKVRATHKRPVWPRHSMVEVTSCDH